MTVALADLVFRNPEYDGIRQSKLNDLVGYVQACTVITGDPTIVALAALDATTGMLVETAAETFAKRTLAAPAAGFTITNPAGVAGNPTFVLANDLAALEAMASTGLVARTAAETYAQRTITGTANRLAVTNGGGVAGNPTLDIDAAYVGQTSITTLGTIATGTWAGTAVSADHGGTGQTVYAVGDLLYASTTTALSKLADVAAGNVLLSGGVTTAPAWGKIGLTTHVSALTASRALVSDGSGFVSVATTTSSEIGYVNGVTSAIQTQIDGKQPLDSDLTTIAGLTATTDNFIVSVSSAWASRTPAQVRATLGLVIGTNVQAYDADLDTWAGITPASGVGTFLATPSSANLASAVTDETGSGKLVFATSPTLVTPILGTPTSGNLANCTGLPNTGVTGLGTMSTQAASAVAITGGTATGLTNITLAGGTFDATAQGQVYSSATLGLVLHGKGSTYDTLFTNNVGNTIFDNPTGTLICEFGGDIYPLNNNTQYLGKNSSSTPRAWKGLILYDQTSGATYRLDINSGAVRLTSL